MSNIEKNLLTLGETVAGLYGIIAVLSPAVCVLASTHPNKSDAAKVFGRALGEIQSGLQRLQLRPDLARQAQKILDDVQGALKE